MLIGLVGKPSAGKSTFFKALTLSSVDIANYPFTTIKPNRAVGYVKVDCVDKDFGKQCNPREGYCKKGFRFVPVEILDVAGLVPGASEGKGMGNQFMDDLRQADVLVHVVDVSGSTNEKGEPVDVGSHDPVEDVLFLEREIDLWYFNILNKVWSRFSKQVSHEKKKLSEAIAVQFSGLNIKENDVKFVLDKLGFDSGSPDSWSEEELKSFCSSLRKNTKPIIIAANKIDVSSSFSNFEKIKEKFRDYVVIPCSSDVEFALKEADNKGFIDYVAGESGFSFLSRDSLSSEQVSALDFISSEVLSKFGGSGVQRVVDCAVFDLLKYIVVFPGGVSKLEDQKGNVLPDCFLMPGGSTALDFAFRLHTDFGKNFIKAIDVKSKLPVGKSHVLENRSVIEIMSRK